MSTGEWASEPVHVCTHIIGSKSKRTNEKKLFDVVRAACYFSNRMGVVATYYLSRELVGTRYA